MTIVLRPSWSVSPRLSLVCVLRQAQFGHREPPDARQDSGMAAAGGSSLSMERENPSSKQPCHCRPIYSRGAASCLAQGEAEGEPWDKELYAPSPGRGALDLLHRNRPAPAEVQGAPGGASFLHANYPGLARPLAGSLRPGLIRQRNFDHKSLFHRPRFSDNHTSCLGISRVKTESCAVVLRKTPRPGLTTRSRETPMAGKRCSRATILSCTL